MTFFFDNNLSQKLAQAINLLEEDHEIMHLKDKFSPDEKDEIWLKHIGDNCIFLITRDKKIRKHPAEIEAIKRNRVGAFILTGKRYTKWQEIKQLICAWEEIKNLADRTHKPFAFQIPLRGKIKPFSL